MPSDYRLTSPATGATLYLVNSTGRPLAGGSPFAPGTTPLGVRPDWTPGASEPAAAFTGGTPLANGSRLAILSNGNVNETLPLVYQGATSDDARRAAQLLRRQFASLFAGPCLLYARPSGALEPTYFAIETAHLEERAFSGTQTSPGEGVADVLLDLTITRQPYGGAATLDTLLSAVSFGNQNSGTPDNTAALEATLPLKGDLIYDGQPLNITVAKPTSQAAAQLYLASIYSATQQTINNAKTTTSTTGTTFTASTAIDVSALRTRAGLKLRVTSRVATLTAPAKAQLQAVVQTASGNVLWTGPWITLGSNTTAQLVDLQGSGLESLRVPLNGASNILIQVGIRSTDGTSVTATLDYIDAVLYYDWCVVEATSGLGVGQRYQLLGAQNLSGAGWLPLVPAAALVTDGSDVPVKAAVIKGQLVRAFAGASLYAAWKESDGGHTKTDTTTITVTHAPLYRSIRGVG